jgi:hypothetical protein
MNQQLIDEINIELNSMKLIVDDIELLIIEVGNNEATNIYKTALGGFAAQFYNGVENILKRIHKSYKIDLPKGENWHLDLLERFSIESGFAIPIKLSSPIIESLTDYRRFRHYFFHGYSHNINWTILLDGVKDIRLVFNQFVQELNNY